MELIVLGASGTWPGPGGATSGYLVRAEGFNLWLDMGSGTMGRLQEHIALAEVGAAAISHDHPDHFVDIYPFFYALHYGRQGNGVVPVYMPPGLVDKATALLSEESATAMRLALDLQTVEPGDAFDVGPFHVQTRPMAHLGDALGFRVECGGAVLAYTGDTGPCEDIEVIGHHADLLIAEATWQDASDQLPFHLSARQAGEHAARAGVRSLMLSHIWPSHDPDVSRAEAAEAFDGEIVIAREGLRVELGR